MTIISFMITNKNIKKNITCDVGLMINCDVAVKKNENKVRISCYYALNTN